MPTSCGTPRAPDPRRGAPSPRMGSSPSASARAAHPRTPSAARSGWVSGARSRRPVNLLHNRSSISDVIRSRPDPATLGRRQALRAAFAAVAAIAVTQLAAAVPAYLRVNRIEGLGALVPVGSRDDILAAFRRFYLYSALSIAVLAAALGIGALLNAVLRAAGVGTALGAADLSRTISLTIAVLAFALPVGGVHLWLIARSLRDPVESGSEARHGYLNAWLLVALVVDLIAGTALISALALPFPSEPAPFIAALVVASAVGLAAWLWVDTTVPEDARRRTQAARVGMAVTMIGATLAMARAAGAAGSLANTTPPEPPRLAPFLTPDLFAGELRAGLVSAAYALVLWTIALLRQWPW